MEVSKMKLFSSLCLYFLNLHAIAAFNLDTNIPIVKEGNKDSYFGFSVAQHIVKEERYDQDGVELDPILHYVVLVGAPRDNVTLSKADPVVRQTNRPGAIHQCAFSSSHDCDQLDLMTSVPETNSQGMPKIDRSDQWLGVTVASTGTPDGKAVACAHRYKKIVNTNSGEISAIWPFGLCVIMYNTLDQDNYYDVCGDRSTERAHKDYGMCQAGTSVFASEENDVLMGAPGVYTWRGMVAKSKLYMKLGDDQTMYLNPHKEYQDPGQLIHPDTKPDSHLGMATSIGRLIRNQTTYIAGAPRSNETGQVFLYLQSDIALEPKVVLSGTQFGSYFGNSIVVGDFNGDGLQDLAIGAPFYYKDGIGGIVYVYIASDQGILPDTEPILIFNKMTQAECKLVDCSNARFGFSLAALDIDLDGYHDLAVGAPFESDGVVYIFRGEEAGLMTEFSQRIEAADLRTARPLSSFGYSLAGGMDADSNSYPDLVVGAYKSDKMVVLRTRPVVNVTVVIGSTPEEIDPREEERCASTGRDLRCFILYVCLAFTAKPYDDFDQELRLEYTVVAETFEGLPRSRVFFKGGDSDNRHIIHRTPTLYKQSTGTCKSEPLVVYIQKGNRDYLNPIRFQLTYKLPDVAPPVMNEGGPIPKINEYPVLNTQVSQVIHAVEFKKNCGDDKRCQSGLSLSARFQLTEQGKDTYILRQGQDLEPTLDITVTNDKEDAHEATLNLTLPENLDYRGIDERGQKYSCILDDSKRHVLCALGNPLTNREKVQFSIRLNPQKLTPTSQDLIVTLRVNTTSDEIDEADNFKVFNIKVVVQTDLLIIGSSQPQYAYFSGEIVGESAIRFEEQIGTEIIHNYEIKNIGHGDVANSTVTVHWPYEVENKREQGKHLLYLIEEPMIDGPGKCFLEDWMVNILKINKKPTNVVAPPNNTESGSSRRRKKREAPQEMKGSNIHTLDCKSGTARCFQFRCVIGLLRAEGDSVVIKIRSRLWNSTFLEDYVHYSAVHVKSMAEVDIADQLNVQQLNYDNDADEASTVVIPGIAVKPPESVPLWIIIVAVLAGVILLCLLIFLLWKCGFFKRTQAEDVQKHKAKVEKKKHTKSNKKNYNYYD